MYRFSNLIKITGIAGLICAIFLGVFLFNKVISAVDETSKERENRVHLAAQETLLVKQLRDLEQASLTDFMTGQYNASELYDIGKKYFSYDLSINGSAVNSGNAQMNVSGSQLGLVITD